MTGLKREQVIESRKKYGGNESAQGSGISVGDCVRRAFINPFSVILFVLAVISLITSFLRKDGYGQGFSSVIIMAVMLLLSGVVRLSRELKAKRVADR